MKHIVDIETWERRDNYAFFRDFLNPWISVATEIHGLRKSRKKA